ncbi:hypothetical protein CTAYLR_008972 [Chrysophaeum taylorii]|uniref:Thioredoxin domain-containing protein n=1 Tax=Chrysophaeum taylorii TaxID=2483200 RepID=A0AAD7XPL3_9STRA|nr:hypothetical protein CTAYLR_008972 [Chrysophaeum taylorii]
MGATSEESSGAGKVAAAAATGSVVAATATAAGTACATGACAVGAAAATSSTVGVSQVAATLLGALGLASTTVYQPAGDLAHMTASSVELRSAVDNGKPSVLEFYSKNCPHCNQVAKDLYAVEKRHNDVNWVMIDTELEANRALWESLGVNEIPHFAFLDADEQLLATAIGPIKPDVAEQGIALALKASANYETN